MIRFESGYDGAVWINPHQVLTVRGARTKWRAKHGPNGPWTEECRTDTIVELYGAKEPVVLWDREPSGVALLIEEALDAS